MKIQTRSRRLLLARWALAFVLGGMASLGHAATFDPEPVAPDLGVQVFDRGVAEDRLGRELFSAPYASVVIGNVDVYDVFPYVESRYFVVVSDPEWNRLIVTATGSGQVSSFDGLGAPCGPLHGPRGLAVDESGRVYVCDTGNDRIVVLQASPEFDRLELAPVGEITGVSHPYGVAVSDAGTPFDGRDDRIYVAESGKNQVSRFVVSADVGGVAAVGGVDPENRTGGNGSESKESADSEVPAESPRSGRSGTCSGPVPNRSASAATIVSYTKTGSIGGLGSGVGRFAGPMALAVGRDGDHSSDRVYVADAHNRRLVELIDDGTGFRWGREASHDGSLVTGLGTDRWGQVYAIAPFEGRISKFSPELEVLAVETEGGSRPRSFHVPFVTTTDHRNGARTWSAEGRGLLVEDWGADTGVRALSLGLEIHGLEPASEDPFRASFALTDPAQVNARLESAAGEVLARRDLGLLAAGRQQVALGPEHVASGASGFPEGSARWIVEARSTYADRAPVVALADTWITGETRLASSTPVFQGSSPNPFVDGTALRFVLPAGASGSAEADIFDLSGRRVRSLTKHHDGGPVDLAWDGRDERGNELGSGIYFYKVRAAGRDWQGRMVRIR